MSDVSDPEDEIVDTGPSRAQAPCAGDQGHGHAHAAHPRVVRQPIKPPPGSDRWPAIYPVYLNSLRTRQQVQYKNLFYKIKKLTLTYFVFREEGFQKNAPFLTPHFGKFGTF